MFRSYFENASRENDWNVDTEKEVLLDLLDELIAAGKCDSDELFLLLNEKVMLDHQNSFPQDSMDGDFDSAMSSAGQGTDEDYNHYAYEDEYDDQDYGNS